MKSSKRKRNDTKNLQAMVEEVAQVEERNHEEGAPLVERILSDP